MGIGPKVMEKLREREGQREASFSIEAQCPWSRAIVDVEGMDTYALSMKGIEIHCLKRHPQRAKLGVKERVEAFMEKVNYLSEPLSMIEIDESLQVAQLRSTRPERRGSQLFFFDLIIEVGKKATLHRFSFDEAKGDCKETTAFILIREVLQNLVNHLAEAVT